MRLEVSTPKTRYRSVKYKLNRQNTSSISCTNDGKFLFNKTSNRKASQSKNHNRMNYTTNIYRNDSQPMDIQNQEDFDVNKFSKSTYLNSFQSIFQRQKSMKQKIIKKMQPSKIRLKQKDSRVLLPVLNQVDSFFTVLDNINLPISYIQDQIVKAEGILKQQEVNIAKIRANLKEIDKKFNRSIQETHNIGLKEFQRLKAMLKSNKVFQQQVRLKHKNSLESSRAYLPQFYKKFQSSKKDIEQLQLIIFANTPFELKQKEEYEVLSSDYF